MSDSPAVTRPDFVRIAVLPALAVAVLAAAMAAVLVMTHSVEVIVTVLVVVAVGFVVAFSWAVREANRARRTVDQQCTDLMTAAGHADAAARAVYQQLGELQRLVDTVTAWPTEFRNQITQFVSLVREGQTSPTIDPPSEQINGRGPLAKLSHEYHQARFAAESAVLAAAQLNAAEGDPAQRLEVFAKFGRRLQSLVHRAIRMLDDLENEVEDPDLLKGLYRVDHLVTGMRRQAENLVVLGGAKAPRQWSKPLSMVAVLRSAVAEVEQYNRVKLVLPIKGTLRGHAVAEIIHLLAELIENATVFSDPQTVVMVRAQTVKAGLAIEVEDRGLGIRLDELGRINGLLAGADADDMGELLGDGLIGLWVVAQLARRNDVRIRLQTNIFGGTSADIVVPHSLLGGETDGAPEQPAAPSAPSTLGVGETHSRIEGLLPDGEYRQPRHAAFTEPEVTQLVVPDHYSWPGVGDAQQQRPVLPKREPGTTNLAPELRQPPQLDAATSVATPDLMATFRNAFLAAGQDGMPERPAGESTDGAG
ncbi:MAG TPA: ATP-binding protein [Pseudonocardiaceae bacterium]|nr:ATP-binding protein [Pseudonocardiaceae bacterium]